MLSVPTPEFLKLEKNGSVSLQTIFDTPWLMERLQKSFVDRKIENIPKFHISPLGRLLSTLTFSSLSLSTLLEALFPSSSGLTPSELRQFLVMQIPILGGTIFTALEFYNLTRLLSSDYISKA